MDMKKILFALSILTLISTVACKTNDKKSASTATLTEDEKTRISLDSANFTSIEWLDSTNANLGKVKEGAIVEVAYRFKNSGTKTLVVEDVTAGCGCTVPEKPEKPIAPGEEGVIRAKFDSKGRVGTNNKYVTVTANTTPSKQQVLQFTVEVTP
jgi:hypothetical protein